MKLEKTIKVKIAAQVWEYPAGNWRFSAGIGISLAVADGFSSQIEAEKAAALALEKIAKRLTENK